MQTWINSWNFFFWLSFFLFLFNTTNFLNLIFYSELTWAILYCYTTLLGSINDELINFSLNFFLLGFAGLEFSIGLLIVINFKNFNKSLDFFNDKKQFTKFLLFKNKKILIKNYFWKK